MPVSRKTETTAEALLLQVKITECLMQPVGMTQQASAAVVIIVDIVEAT